MKGLSVRELWEEGFPRATGESCSLNRQQDHHIHIIIPLTSSHIPI